MRPEPEPGLDRPSRHRVRLRHRPRPGGLRPTIQQWMVLVAIAAVATAAVDQLPGTGPSRTDWHALALGVGLWAVPSVVILIGLVLVLDRPGAAWRWRALGLASVMVPATALVVGLAVVTRSGRLVPADVLIAAAINAALLLGALRFIPAFWPARCPNCQARALVPAFGASVNGDSVVDDDLRECAECRALFRRPRWRWRHGRSRLDEGAVWRLFEPGGRAG